MTPPATSSPPPLKGEAKTERNPMPITIQPARADQWREIAHLIYHSTNAWYEKNRGFKAFSAEPDCGLLFPRTYAALDGPENTLVAWDSDENRIVGSCFVHPRATHISLGILNVHPDAFGKHVAPKLMAHIVELARAANKPLRLVSSAMNLDSFSVYSRLGFIPYEVYQDVMVPNFQPSKIQLSDEVQALVARVREAVPADVPGIVALEAEQTGLEHAQDYTYFIQNVDGIWKTWVLEDADGKISGVLGSVCDPGSCMLGPGVMTDENRMLALIYTALSKRAEQGATPIFLVPTKCSEAVRTLYSWGARNTEIHVGQCLGGCDAPKGIVMPTFMPE